MSKLLYLTGLFAAVSMITGCQKDDEVNLISLIQNEWTHSREEQSSQEIEIYRPSNFKEFPLSRYRQIFSFRDNNRCDYLVLAENDAHFMASGIWEYDDKTRIVRIFNSNFELQHEFEIVEIAGNLLKIKPKN
jgi:hypothetical protein